MIYLAIQILFFLIVSVVLGFIFGWWLKSAFFGQDKLANAAVVEGLREELSEARQARDIQDQELSEAQAAASEITSLRDELRVARQQETERQSEIARLQAATNETGDAAMQDELASALHDCEVCQAELETLRARVAALEAGAQ